MSQQKKSQSRDEELTSQGFSSITRIVLDAREDIFIFGTEDMKALVNDFEDKYPDEDIRGKLKEDLVINKSGVILMYKPNHQEDNPEVFTSFTLVHFLGMTLFLNQLSLRGVIDKLDLGRVGFSVSQLLDGMMKVKNNRKGLVSQKGDQVGPPKGKGPTYGGL